MSVHAERLMWLNEAERFAVRPEANPMRWTPSGDYNRCTRQDGPTSLSRCVGNAGHEGECLCVRVAPMKLAIPANH